MKIIVVGAGFSGTIMARKIAEELGHDVELIERRDQISGNMYDYVDENGILIQKYGPHFLNTNKYWIIDYLKRFTSLVPHDCRLLTVIDGRYMRLPFNFTTVKQLIGEKAAEPLLQNMREEFRGEDRVPMERLLNSRHENVREFANTLYSKAFRTYTAKQWGIPIEKVDKSVINRVQFCVGYDSRYLNKDFQFLPEYGFTKLFESMVDHPKIHLKLNEDAIEHIRFGDDSISYDGEKVDLLVFTGEIDALFGYRFGRLPYRSLYFKYEYHDCDRYLPEEIISYPQAEGYTRSTEYKFFNFHCDNKEKTVVVTEYPVDYDPSREGRNVPCYPVITKDNVYLYLRYKSEAERYKNLFICGRLAEYKYYNMDLVIESTFEKFEFIKEFLKRKDT